MSKPDGGPAFPMQDQEFQSDGMGWKPSVPGMSLRDYFAAAALQGILAHDSTRNNETAAGRAYGVADAMLAKREKP